MNESLVRGLCAAAIGAALLAFGYLAPPITAKLLVFVLFASVGAILMALPLEYSIFTLFIYLGFEGFAKLMSNYNPVVHVGSDILIVALCGRVLLTSLIRRSKFPTEFPPLTPLFALHFLWFIVTIANPYALGLIPSLAGAKMYVTIVLLYFFGYYLSTSTRNVRLFMIPWVLISVLQAVTSIYQSAIGPASVTWLSPMYAERLKHFEGYAFRPFGTTANPGAPSVFVFMAVPFLLFFILHSRSLLSKALLIAAVPASAVTLFVCQVRAALLKAMVGALSYVLLTAKSFGQFSIQKRRRILAGLVVGGIITAVTVPRFLSSMVESYEDNARAIERTLSLFDYDRVKKSREGSLERFLMYVKMAPFGAGLSRTGSAAGKFQHLNETNRYFHIPFFADNLWIAMVVDLGLPGVFILTTIFIAIFAKSLLARARIANPELKAAHAAIFSALGAVLLGGYGAEPVLYNPEGSFFWFFAGVLMRIPEIKEYENAGL